MNATSQEIQAAELRLPLIGNSCTVIATFDNIISTKSMPMTATVASTLLSTNNSKNQQATTLPIASDGISGSPTTKESSDIDDGQFLSLSLMEFILLVVILAVVIIAVFVVITVICCCCLYVQVRVANNNSGGKSIFCLRRSRDQNFIKCWYVFFH